MNNTSPTAATALPPCAGSRPLAPRGGNDRVYTPHKLAWQIVEHFKPSGTILEPCSGRGAFVNPLLRYAEGPMVSTCEIDDGVDFFNAAVGHHDWIITNPPWSQFRRFLCKSMEVADNVVFLSLLNAWFMRARVADMRAAGFGIAEVLMVDTPPKPWPQTGFQLAAVHIRRGHAGPTTFSYANTEVRHPAPDRNENTAAQSRGCLH